MHNSDSGLRLSPSDLAGHLACRHLTQLNLGVARDLRKAPTRHDPFLDSLIERGNEHEAAFVERLRASGRSVADLREASPGDLNATRQAIAAGTEVIVQAPLAEGQWTGRADILLRRQDPGDFAAYEPIDTKLAAETRAGTILQLSAYADMVGALIGKPPEHLHVVTPLAHETYRTNSVAAYFRFVRRKLLAAVQEPEQATYPEPVPHCDVCRWWSECDSRRRTDDHLCLVAGIHTLHIRELVRQNVATVEHLGALGGLPEPPSRGTRETFDRLEAQARLQVVARSSTKPPFEYLTPPPPDRGLARLPEPSPADLFFDFEGDPFVDSGGLEYLTGWVALEPGGSVYHDAWAINREQERRAFEAFMDFAAERMDESPGFHIYHFHHYEPSALKRLVGRYGTRADVLDRLLRGRRMVDLRIVIRESMRVGIERYGLKEMEALTGYERKLDLKEAGVARRDVELALERGAGVSISEELQKRVTDYNREDCESTKALRDWLEHRRAELIEQGHDVPRPLAAEDAASENVTAREEKIGAVVDALMTGLPDDPETRTQDQKARWLLAQMAGYFHREEKCGWWEHFRLRDLDHEDLLTEREAISGLLFESELPRKGKQRVPTHRYRFPQQEVALRAGKKVRIPSIDDPDDTVLGEVVAIDLTTGTVDIKKTGRTASMHPGAVFREQVVRSEALEDSLLALGTHAIANGLDGPGSFQAARDLLLRLPPRRGSSTGNAVRNEGEGLLDAAIRLAHELDGGTLPIQGPPGSGKTFAGSRMIASLVVAGHKVGITAVSHKVINNLLDEVRIAAKELRKAVRLVHLGGDEPDTSVIEPISDNKKAIDAIDTDCVLGATAWLWSRPDAAESLDYLFVDEAGQMALAQVLAASRSARNLVLLGDPQQLEQPRRGSHPDGTEVAALVHVVGPSGSTLDSTQGLFLDRTWRLHPDICAFTSECYYDSRLAPIEGLEQQVIGGPTRFAGQALHLVEVEHEGNQASCPEEVDKVASIVDELLVDGATWTDRKGITHPLTARDLLIVAPYNAQIAELQQALASRGVDRVGTVDRFQGQEAPVVVYSCTSSSADDAPRGMAFLYDPHRFNVASSRARCCVIVVANRSLFEPECRTPEQVSMANGLCRYRELALSQATPRRLTTS
tara:strand:- start:35651 stop:39082 length:3432 start_codon:yes stop_codon:yes gene_type:complete